MQNVTLEMIDDALHFEWSQNRSFAASVELGSFFGTVLGACCLAWARSKRSARCRCRCLRVSSRTRGVLLLVSKTFALIAAFWLLVCF